MIGIVIVLAIILAVLIAARWVGKQIEEGNRQS
jgi:hypothetical protein